MCPWDKSGVCECREGKNSEIENYNIIEGIANEEKSTDEKANETLWEIEEREGREIINSIEKLTDIVSDLIEYVSKRTEKTKEEFRRRQTRTEQSVYICGREGTVYKVVSVLYTPCCFPIK